METPSEYFSVRNERGSHRCGEVPLSSAQEAILGRMRHQGFGNVIVSIGLYGSLDLSALRKAVCDVMSRQKLLDTTFPSVDGGPPCQQTPTSNPEPHIASVPFWGVGKLLTEQAHEPFDLANSVPIRFFLCTLSPIEHVLLIAVHPIAVDAKSIDILIDELVQAYSLRTDGRSHEPRELQIQYADYALWEKHTLGDVHDPQSALGRQCAYWQRALAGLAPLRNTSARTLGSVGPRVFHTVPIAIDETLHARIATFAQSQGIGSAIVLCASLAMLATRLRLGNDVVVGFTVPRRTGDALGAIVGPFSNVVPIRIDTSTNPGFVELIRRVRRELVYAMANQDVPFPYVARLVDNADAQARLRLIKLSLQQKRVVSQSLASIEMSVAPVDTLPSDHEIDVDLIEHMTDSRASGIRGVIRFSSTVLDKARAERVALLWVSLLRRSIAHPDVPTRSNSADRHRLLSGAPSVTRRTRPKPAPPRRRDWYLENGRAGEWADRPMSPADESVPYNVAPADPLQCQLAFIWERVLKHEGIGIWDDFFDICGSLEDAREMLRIVQETCMVKLDDALLSPPLTIERLADAMQERRRAGPIWIAQPGDESCRPKFFFVHGDMNGGGFYTAGLARGTGPDQPFYVLQSHRPDEPDFPSSIEEMANSHISAVKHIQPSGPYYLGGYCNGGIAALEMARRLVNQGDAVRILVLIDAPYLWSEVRSEPVHSPPEPPPGWQHSPRTRRAWVYSRFRRVLFNYRPAQYCGNVRMLMSGDGSPVAEKQWLQVTPDARYVYVGGDHLSLLSRQLPQLATALRESLDEVYC